MKGILLLLAMHISICSMAKTISQEEALSKALRFVQPAAMARGISKAEAPQLTLAYTAAEGDETYYYVFNNANGGYVIVGGDDVAHDVLAYGETGSFDATQLPPAMKWWLGQYEKQIHRAIVSGNQPAARYATRASEREDIEPLLGGIKWGQRLPFNALINDNAENPIEGGQTVAGCVATATAQVMRYWKYPAKGVGMHSYRVFGQTQSADFSQTEYKWDLMQETYEPGYKGTPEERAVAELTYHVGVAVNMFYVPGGSSGSMTEGCVPYALQTFFGYSKDMKVYDRIKSGLTDEAWEDIIYTELAEGRPVIYSGGHHTFVCDGYQDGRFHINWGWNGMSDDYFLLTATDDESALKVEMSGTGGNASSCYDEGQNIIVGIHPGDDVEGGLYVPDALAIDDEIPAAPLKFNVKVCNPTSHDISILPVVRLIDGQKAAVLDKIDTLVVEVSKEPINVAAKGETIIPVEIPQGLLEESAMYSLFFYNELDNTVISIATPLVEGESMRILSSICSVGLSTICLPFDYTMDETSPFEAAYAATGINKNKELILEPVTTLKAGYGYVIKGTPGAFMLNGIPTTDQPVEDQVLIGVLDPNGVVLSAGSFAIIEDVEGETIYFGRIIEDSTLDPYLATVNPAFTQALKIRVNLDTVTGIESISNSLNSNSTSSRTYNLYGIPVGDGYKGVVIKDGRKVVR